MLHIIKIAKSFADDLLFSGLSLTIGARDRIALLGPNGSGKTTLFEMIAGNLTPNEGSIVKGKNVTIGYLKQDIEPEGDKGLLEDAMSASEVSNGIKHRIDIILQEIEEAENDAEREPLLKELGELQHRFEAEGGYDTEYKVKAILCGLGFKEADFGRSLNEFSGGWLMRSALAKLLISNPDLLLLDEPTNHLDLESCIWFENYLSTYEGAVLTTSHDRAFLNRVVKRIIALENHKAIHHAGNYDSFITARQKEKEMLEAAAKRQEKMFKKETRFIERFRYKETKASQVQSRIKMLARIEKIEVPRSTKRVNFKFPEPARSGETVITLKGVHKAYGKNKVYEGLDFGIQRGDKVALVGPNGAGKTTLLKILAGVLPFEKGERNLGHKVDTSYYAQHQLELLSEDNNMLKEMDKVAPEDSEHQQRGILGAFLFSGDDVLKHVRVLSGGEKARLALAKMLVRPANMIFMDEPTNHLDIASREVLTDALEAYSGTLCFITHDRTLIRQIANKIVEVEKGNLTIYQGDYDYYLYKKEQAEKREKAAESKAHVKQNAESGKKRKQLEASLRNEYFKKIKPIKSKIQVIEKNISELEEERAQIEAMFASSETFSNSEDVVKITERHKHIKRELGELEAAWGELTHEDEALKEELEEKLSKVK